MNLIDIKRSNRNAVFRLVYQNEKISKPEIAAALGISVPTVAQCVNELKEEGLVSDQGLFQSSGGRKAAIISCCRYHRIAVGVELRRDYVHLAAVDLYGQIMKSEDQELRFDTTDLYCAVLGNIINNFIISLNIVPEALLGVGIAIQGLTDLAGEVLVFGKILNASGFSIENIQRYLSFPCTMQHDSEAAAQFSFWHMGCTQDHLYLVLNPYVGGAVILNGDLLHGKYISSGLIEHMVLVPGGRPCYCGKRGCVNAYCSSDLLLDPQTNTLEGFFQKLHAGDPECAQQWTAYLGDLAKAIYNYQILLNTEVVLSGAVAPYIRDEDLGQITDSVRELYADITDQIPEITVSSRYDAAAGAALNYIKSYLASFH